MKPWIRKPGKAIQTLFTMNPCHVNRTCIHPTKRVSYRYYLKCYLRKLDQTHFQRVEELVTDQIDRNLETRTSFPFTC